VSSSAARTDCECAEADGGERGAFEFRCDGIFIDRFEQAPQSAPEAAFAPEAALKRGLP